MKAIKVNAQTAQEWLQNAAKFDGTYVPDASAKPVPVPAGSYEVKEGVTATGRAYTQVCIMLEGSKRPLSFFLHRIKTVDADLPVNIVKLVASNPDFRTSDGKAIPVGTVAWKALQGKVKA